MKSKDIIKFFGFGWVLGTGIYMLYALIHTYIYGVWVIQEPNKFILGMEIACIIFSIGFIVYYYTEIIGGDEDGRKETE